MSNCGESKEHDSSAACADDRKARELSLMISELNEVRMRLDAVVRKLTESTRMAGGDADPADDIEALRIRLNSQLDRLRHKLVSQIPEQA